MSLTVDSESSFGTGPAVVIPSAVERVYRDPMFPGVLGRSRLHLKGTIRKLTQAGILTATGETAAAACAALHELIDAIEGLDGVSTPLAEGTHTLVDDDGVSYADATLDVLEIGGRVIYLTLGEASFEARCPYVARWTQLQPTAATPPEEE